MNWNSVKLQVQIYLNLVIIWAVLSLIIQWCINQWLIYFQQPEISFWQSLSLLVMFLLFGWLYKYIKNF